MFENLLRDRDFDDVVESTYLPDVKRPAYADLLASLEQEFTHAFGGSTVVRGLDGSFLSRIGMVMRDRVNLLYTDAPYGLSSDFALVSNYADELRDAAFHALDEEAILVVVISVYHSN